VFVNGESVQVPKGVSVMQACDAAGVDVPRFCYHQRLSIAGNCRMCLVEVTKSPKPVASCAMPIMPGMQIHTETPLVKKAREGVMEFLLANHPLDCPICDQGGECDLQDMSMAYGSDRGRFVEEKRAVEDKNLGPLVKTVMTRCIHCTRCVRFATEVAGVHDLGVTGRGGSAEIGTYLEKALTSEMSGNVIDLCPVGALTSKPYAFTARSWELRPTESVDATDGIGASIRVDARGHEVMRIVPRLNESVNEEWIGDRGRFSYDGLRRQRLDAPYVRGEKGAPLRKATWKDALEAAAHGLRSTPSTKLMAVAGKLADAESICALKDLMAMYDGQNLQVEGVTPSSDAADVRSSYVFNSTLERIEEADAILLVGTDLRKEAPLLNSRLRRSAVYNCVPVASVGPDVDLTYPKKDLGDSAKAIDDLLSGASAFRAVLDGASKPAIIVGAHVLSRPDAYGVLSKCVQLANDVGCVSGDWNGYNVLHECAGRVAALDLGFVPGPKADVATAPGFVYLMNADDEATLASIPEDAFVVYQGHHGDAGAARANVVLPGAAYTEKGATYVNTEGRVQRTKRAVPPPGSAREDWEVVRALSEVAGLALPYDDVDGLRVRMAEVSPTFASVDSVQQSTIWLNGSTYAASKGSSKASTAPFTSSISNYFQADVIGRSSKTMARCVETRGEMYAKTHDVGSTLGELGEPSALPLGD